MSLYAPPEALVSDLLAVRHGFVTRRNGVSVGPYASLNCSTSGQDDPASVAENRARVAHALGTDPRRLVGLSQVHGAEVIVVDAPWTAGAGARADAMVTCQPGIALGIITADCAPVLLADAQARVIGAVHAGWRGALAGVLEATVEAMRRLGAETSRIAAVIGPCIAQKSYEVGEDLRSAVVEQDVSASRFFAPGRRALHSQFDLAGYCLSRLAAAGLSQIGVLGVDTLSDETRFYSHRRRTLAGGGVIGHQISAIIL